MPKAKIMIVEDEFIIQTLMKARLDKLGYEIVAVASEGEEAIQKACDIKPDLILMDIQLEGRVDGIEAAVRIKEQVDIPVVFTTAYSDEDRVERAKLSTPSGYLVKPVQERDLKITLNLALYAAEQNKARIKAEQELQDTVVRLEEAVKTVKKLSGLLPICASCKKIRDDSGYWNQIESFIENHSEAQFSHSVCPECAEKLYGNEKWFKGMKDRGKPGDSS